MRPALALLLVTTFGGCALMRPAVLAPVDLHAACATAMVVGLRWHGASPNIGYRVERDGVLLGTAADGRFDDLSVAPATRYTYVIGASERDARTGAAASLTVTTAPESPNGDAPYCASSSIQALTWDWAGGYRAAQGSDLWPVTWGDDGNVYAFFGDGGGFGGDDLRGRTSFGIAMLEGRPPLRPADETNVYGGFEARFPARLDGKARALLAVGTDFYAIAGIYRRSDAKFGRPSPISGSPEHEELIYSRHDAHSWTASGWTFCDSDQTSLAGVLEAFCPSGFVNAGRGYRSAPDRYVYLFGASPAADRHFGDALTARTYLARVDAKHVLTRAAYRYFAGLDAHSAPIWSKDTQRLQPVFVDRNSRGSSTLEEAVYNPGLARYIGVAQADNLAQTSFYESAHPWGPWATLSYDNVDAAGEGGWGHLGTVAGGSLGVHPVNAWTSTDGRTMWMVYSSDGVAGAQAQFPSPGTKLDAFHLVRVQLQPRQ